VKKYSRIALIALSFIGAPASADIKPIIQLTGQLTVSADANGNNGLGGGFLRVDKPAGGTVRAAYLMAASHGVFGHRVINDGDVVLAGKAVNWDRNVFNNAGFDPIFFHNVFADVTAVIKPIIDPAGPGITLISVQEMGTTTINGTILVVVFKDPNQAATRSFLLLFGGQNTLGDTFLINLAAALAADPNLTAIMGLGIAHGFQASTGTPQVSLIDVNGSRLTSSAGGEDDGISEDGALITVGGIGDSIANPPAPFAPSTGFRTDDELYDLRPFLKVGDASIVVHTVNPTNDDDILLAYFVTSFQAAILPPVAPPGFRKIVGNINPNLPTIVLTHGLQKRLNNQDEDLLGLWTGTGPKQAAELIQNSLGTAQVNIVQYVWQEAFQPYGCIFGLPDDEAYIGAQTKALDAGQRLARELFDALGAGYDKPVHFIGHSLGTAVNTYAARAFLEAVSGVKKVQFTALDRPDHVGVRICGLGPIEASRHSYGRNFFASNLPISRTGLALRIDNYFTLDCLALVAGVCLAPSGAGVGDEANGDVVYNHRSLKDSFRVGDHFFKDESIFGFIDNDHSGVQQWYRWTMSPNDPLITGLTVCDGENFAANRKPADFDDSLNPCQKGWFWSLPKNLDAFPNNFPAANGKPLRMETPKPVQLADPRSFGCTTDLVGGITRISCKEASSPFFMAQVDIPDDADFLTFEYNFSNSGDGDYAAVLLDDVPVWVLSGSSTKTGRLLDSGAIPVDGLRGPHTLTVALYGVGQPNFEFTVQNFNVFGVTVLNPAPLLTALSPTSAVAGGPPVTLSVSGSGFVSGATVFWNGSARPTTFVSDTEVAATVSASDIASSGVFNVTVQNPDPTVGPSGPFAFTVNNPQPFLSSLSPANIPASSGGFTLNVTGSGFVSGSVVRWNGSDRPTTLVSSVQLQTSISASDIAAGGTAQVTVMNPAPGGGTSSALAFAATDFAVSVAPTSASVAAGQSASYTLTLAPQFGPFSSAITFNCTNLPPLSQCSVSPASVTPGASSAIATLTVSTTAPSVVFRLPSVSGDPTPLLAAWLAALALVMIIAVNQRGEKRRYATGSLAAALLLLVFLVSCGGGGAPPPPPRPGTPPGTYTVTVTGTAGSLTHTAQIQLTVR